jgi:hypothetical protein
VGGNLEGKRRTMLKSKKTLRMLRSSLSGILLAQLRRAPVLLLVATAWKELK